MPFNVSHNMDATNIHAELFFCSCSYVMALKSKCKWVQETCILRLILIPITSDFDFGLTHFGRTWDLGWNRAPLGTKCMGIQTLLNMSCIENSFCSFIGADLFLFIWIFCLHHDLFHNIVILYGMFSQRTYQKFQERNRRNLNLPKRVEGDSNTFRKWFSGS